MSRPTDAAPLGFGFYERGDNLHVDLPELLLCFGWPDTPANRDRADALVREVIAERFSGMSTVDDDGRPGVPHVD
jgi:hypothetical protein